MVKKCPPGIICIENYTFIFFIFLLLTVLFFMYIKYNKNLKNGDNIYLDNTKNYNNCDSCKNKNCHCNSLHISNHENLNKDIYNDVLLNPYTAPMRDDRIFNNNNNSNFKIPINIPTQSFDTNYRQIGILTRVNGPETILPLLGRPLFSNRDKWNFYTMNDKNNMIKLPITFKNKSCTSQQGCDNIYNGDTVLVEGYNDIFRATIYDNNTMQYIPYL